MATAHLPHTVGILGGMGPAAGADFVRLFVQACTRHIRGVGTPVHDQNFPEHWLAQVPVPDRTNALRHAELGAHQPLEPMLQALGQLAALGSQAVAIACNTAHAWHGSLQDRFPQVEVLHVAREVTALLKEDGIGEVALMATEGTYLVGLYEQALQDAGIRCHLPTADQRAAIMDGIYQGVKAGNLAHARRQFAHVAQDLQRRHGPVRLILGCTEIPLAFHDGIDAVAGSLIDPAQVLATALAKRAYATG